MANVKAFALTDVQFPNAGLDVSVKAGNVFEVSESVFADFVRLKSARKATKAEIDQYEAAKEGRTVQAPVKEIAPPTKISDDVKAAAAKPTTGKKDDLV